LRTVACFIGSFNVMVGAMAERRRRRRRGRGAGEDGGSVRVRPCEEGFGMG
jgi:hypothetical protein